MAKNSIVNLERFWLPAGKSYSLTSDGWLSDPESTSLWRANTEATSTRELATRRAGSFPAGPAREKPAPLLPVQPLGHIVKT